MCKIKKKYLPLPAGLLWMAAGVMVAQTGLPLLAASSSPFPALAGAVVTFLLFYLGVFSSLIYRHEKRIRSYKEEKLPFWRFFDVKSYVIMVVMMSGGIFLRLFNILPFWFIGFFYSGLGIALFACGFRFFWRYRFYEEKIKRTSRLDKNNSK